MNYSKAIFLISDKVRAVNCTYENQKGEKSYTFKTLDQTIKAEDYVIVQTDTRYKMTVCKVADIDVDFDFDDGINFKWIVGKVDKTAFDKILAQEAEATSKIKRAETFKKRKELRESIIDEANGDLKSLPIYSLDESKS